MQRSSLKWLVYLYKSFSAYVSPLFQRGARGDLKKGEDVVCAALGAGLERHTFGTIACPLAAARRLRMLCGGLFCLVFTGIAAAQDTPGTPPIAWAIGLPDGYVIMEHQASTIEVGAADAARGVVEVRGGSRLVITLHAPSGYAVDFRTRGTVFQPIEIDGIGAVVELSPHGGTVAQRQSAGRRVIEINYRFALAPGTAPGTYAWPLDLAVRSPVTVDLQHLARNRRDATLSGRAGE